MTAKAHSEVLYFGPTETGKQYHIMHRWEDESHVSYCGKAMIEVHPKRVTADMTNLDLKDQEISVDGLPVCSLCQVAWKKLVTR